MKKAAKYRLIALGVILGVPALTFLYLAFGPTGYSRLEQKCAPSVQRMDALMQPAPMARTGVTTETADAGARRPASPGSALMERAKDPSKTNFIGVVFGIYASGVKLERKAPGLFTSAFGAMLPDCFDKASVLILANQTGTMTAPPSISQLPTDMVATMRAAQAAARQMVQTSTDLGATMDAAARQVVQKRLDDHKRELASAPATSRSLPIAPEDFPSIKKELSIALDEVDRLLLDCEWEIPPLAEFPSFAGCLEKVSGLSWMAILRAHLSGDDEKAARLLARYADALRIVQISLGPCLHEDVSPLAYAHACIFMLGEQDNFPMKALSETSGTLERTRLTREQIQDSKMAWGARLEHELAALDAMPLPSSARGSFDFMKTRARVMSKFFEALICRDSERALAGMLDPAHEGVNGALARLEIWDAATNYLAVPVKFRVNLSGPFGSPTGKTSPILDLYRFARGMNDIGDPEDADYARVILAAVCYRRDQGRYPRSIEELSLRYLDGNAASSLRNSWRIFEAGDWAVMSPFGATMDEFQRAIHDAGSVQMELLRLTDTTPSRQGAKRKGPTRPSPNGDVPVGDKGHAEGQLRYLWASGGPIICHFNLDRFLWRSPSQLKERPEWIGQHYAPEAKRLEEQIKTGAQSVIVIRATLRFPVYPLVAPELLELLRNTQDVKGDGEAEPPPAEIQDEIKRPA